MGINTPLPQSLREESAKAARIVRSFVDTHNNGLDKVIPRYVLERASGFAIFTVAKAGFLVSARAGSGIVIAKTDDGSWSPPCAIGIGGIGFGGQAGAEVTDFFIVLNNRAAVANFMSAGSLTLGGNMSVAVGPLGRNAEGSGAVNTRGQLAAMYSYSKTKGLFGGMSVEGTIITERQDANRIAYGGSPSAKAILTGAFDPPDWAYVLIDALDRATGMPGGQLWINDAPEDKGAMGWGSPTRSRNGSGYAFGEGVGAGGTSSGNRKRSSSLFSIGNNKAKEDRVAAGAMFSNGHSTPGTPASPSADRLPPSRPWEQRRASAYIPFSKSMSFNGNKDRRAAGPSSETYNADYERNTSSSPRRSSIARPYKVKPTPSPFASELDGSRNNTPRSSPPRSMLTRSPVNGAASSNSDDSLHTNDLIGPDDWEAPRAQPAYGRARKGSGDRDLIGSWDADPHGLTANFGRMSVGGKAASPNNTGPRSRRASTLPFGNIDEDPDAARLRETTSTYATRDWALPTNALPRNEKKTSVTGLRERRERPFSSYAAPTGWNWQDDPFGTPSVNDDSPGYGDYDFARPFDDYAPKSRAPAAKPRLSLKQGLDTADGYARAVALFDFAGGQDGDLSFRKGDVLAIVSGAGDSHEWWSGRTATSSKEGIFPANYVEVLDIPRDMRTRGLTRADLRARVIRDDFD